MRDGGLTEADRFGEVADARLVTFGCRDDRHEPQAHRVGECLEAAGEHFGISRGDGFAGEGRAARGTTADAAAFATDAAVSAEAAEPAFCADSRLVNGRSTMVTRRV